MTGRVTTTALQAAVDRLNRLTDSPMAAYTRNTPPAVGFTPNPGNFHLDNAYGKYTLSRMCLTGGGEVDVLACGFVSKGKLFDLIHAFIRGVTVGKGLEVPHPKENSHE